MDTGKTRGLTEEEIYWINHHGKLRKKYTIIYNVAKICHRLKKKAAGYYLYLSGSTILSVGGKSMDFLLTLNIIEPKLVLTF